MVWFVEGLEMTMLMQTRRDEYVSIMYMYSRAYVCFDFSSSALNVFMLPKWIETSV